MGIRIASGRLVLGTFLARLARLPLDDRDRCVDRVGFVDHLAQVVLYIRQIDPRGVKTFMAHRLLQLKQVQPSKPEAGEDQLDTSEGPSQHFQAIADSSVQLQP